MEWQPRETAPKDGTAFLVNAPLEVGGCAICIWFEDEDAGFSGFIYADDVMTNMYPEGPEDATHWMPLPPPPGKMEDTSE